MAILPTRNRVLPAVLTLLAVLPGAAAAGNAGPQAGRDGALPQSQYAAAPTSPAATPPDPLVLLDAALSAPERSYQGHMMVTEWFGKQSRAEEVEISYSPINRYRWEFLAPDGSVSRIAVSDGSSEQLVLVNQGRTLQGEAVRSATKLMFPEREKELLLKNYRLSVTGPDKVAGRKVWVLNLRPVVPGKPHQQLWFDAQTQIILAIKRYLPKKRFAASSRFTHFDLKSQLPEELFAVKAASPMPVSSDMGPDFLSIDELEKATGRETDLPDELPGGFVFESADFFEVGKDTVRHLRYTDGLAVLSIFLTDRPVRLPAGGAAGLSSLLSPPGSLRISSTGKVFAWQRGRQHYTLMSDVSRDLLGRIALRATPPRAAARKSVAAPAAAGPAPEGRIRWTKLAGSVESVEQPAGRLWVRAKTGKSRDFAVTEATDIFRDKKPAKLADVRPGDKVRLLRYNSATREIKKIELVPAPPR